VKTVWLLIVLLTNAAAAALAQVPTNALRPAAESGLQMSPVGQAELPAVSKPPEPVPPGHPQAAPPPPMTLADLDRMAETNNPTLAWAAARVGAARGEWTQVGLPPNPTAGYLASEIGDDGRAGQQGAFVAQEFVTGGKLRLNREVAAQAVRQAEQQCAAQRFRVLNDVRIDFYEVLIAQRKIEIAQELAGVSDQGFKAAESFMKAKEGSRVDLLQASIEANTAKMVLESARNDYLAAWRRLTAVIGLPETQPTPLNGDLREAMPEISFDDAMHRLLATSPEVASAQIGIERAQAAINRARVESIPNVQMQVSMQHDNSTGSNIAGVQVGVPLPLFNRNQGGERRAETELAVAQNDYRRVQLDLHHRLATVYQQYANSKHQVEIYSKSILPDAEASLKLVANGYHQGQFTYWILLTAQRTYFQTQLAYLDALKQLRRSSVEIEGMLLTDSLKEDKTAR
jgi:cobalt-zinc-cadmium efflux system outer membrane protein